MESVLMSFIWNLKITTKIVGLLMMLGVVVIGVAGYGSLTLKTTNRDFSTLTEKELPNAQKLTRINRLGVQMMFDAYRVLYYPGASAEAHSADSDEKKSFGLAIKALDEIKASDPALGSKSATIREQIVKLHALTRRAIAFGLANENDMAFLIMVEADKLTMSLNERSTVVNEGVIAQAAAESKALKAQTDTASIMMLAGSLLAVLVAVGGSMLVARVGITGPLNRLKGAMAAIAGGNNGVDVPGTERRDEIGDMAKTVLIFRVAAVALATANDAKQRADADQAVVVGELTTNLRKLSEGDLTARIDADVSTEYRDLKSNFNEALTSLNDAIGAVSTGAAAIRTGSIEIAQASEDLARRTETNAASLEETSAALVEIDGRLKASATASARTVSRADQAIATVDSGRLTAGEAVAAMGRVRDSAKGIDDVIEGLDKIAFQTRVLAMNAAVEAGRAGEAGRGFAVVADLVSALAMRAEEEAKRARDQLTVTQSEVVTAVAAVHKVDGALSAISGDVAEVHTLLLGMAADNEAQATGITQITTAVGTMDKSTQQNAAMVEETSAAARNLTTEVSELTTRTAIFKTVHNASRLVHPNRAEPARPAKQAQAIMRPKAELRLAASGDPANSHANGHAIRHATGGENEWADF